MTDLWGNGGKAQPKPPEHTSRELWGAGGRIERKANADNKNR